MLSSTPGRPAIDNWRSRLRRFRYHLLCQDWIIRTSPENGRDWKPQTAWRSGGATGPTHFRSPNFTSSPRPGKPCCSMTRWERERIFSACPRLTAAPLAPFERRPHFSLCLKSRFSDRDTAPAPPGQRFVLSRSAHTGPVPATASPPLLIPSALPREDHNAASMQTRIDR